MEEKDFTLLDTLGKTRNITKAADSLFTTQSALSKRIMTLEQELGITLMTRSRQGIRFTPEGEIVLAHVRRASETLSAMRAELEASRDYVSGTMSAGISVNYARYILPDILASFRKDYPHVITHISIDQSRNIFTRLLKGEFDLAVVRGIYDWKEKSILLSSENICAVLGRSDAGRELSSIPYIGRKTDAAFEREILQWMRENGLKSEAGIYVDSIETCTEMARRGLGWAIVPEICLKNFDGEIRELVFSDGRAFTRTTYLLYTDEAAKLPQVKAFTEAVQKFHERM